MPRSSGPVEPAKPAAKPKRVTKKAAAAATAAEAEPRSGRPVEAAEAPAKPKRAARKKVASHRGGGVVGAPASTAPRRVPSRSCVACRTARPKRELLRIVRTPDGRVVADPTGRLAGRGAYVCDEAACIEQAITKGALARALKSPSCPPDLRETLAAEGDPLNMTIEGGARGQE